MKQIKRIKEFVRTMKVQKELISPTWVMSFDVTQAQELLMEIKKIKKGDI
jgi:hypothetical protein